MCSSQKGWGPVASVEALSHGKSVWGEIWSRFGALCPIPATPLLVLLPILFGYPPVCRVAPSSNAGLQSGGELERPDALGRRWGIIVEVVPVWSCHKTRDLLQDELPAGTKTWGYPVCGCGWCRST